jgi:hypothetical protein
VTRLLFILGVTSAPAFAQTYELAVQLTGVHLHKTHESPFGVGGRFHYNLSALVAADMELTYYPENSSGNFGETGALVGVRAGKRFDRVGFFGKVRPGVMHFGGNYFNSRLDQETHLVFDVGGVFEYYPSRRTFMRIDVGDTVIHFGGFSIVSIQIHSEPFIISRLASGSDSAFEPTKDEESDDGQIVTSPTGHALSKQRWWDITDTRKPASEYPVTA